MASSDTLYITKIDEVYIKIDCEMGVAQELCDYFTFYVPGYTFVPSYRNKLWDGKIRLFSVHTRKLYGGLMPYVVQFAYKRQYKYEYSDDLAIEKVSLDENFIEKLNLQSNGNEITVRDYQIDAINHAISSKKILLVSPTASGKSLIIYLLLRFLKVQTLIIVPTTSLVEQMYTDFMDYSANDKWYVDLNCHKIYSGQPRKTSLPVVISTWQSLVDEKKDFFKRFEMVIGDEAHGFKAKSLTSIMTKLVNAKYRIGTTGTLDGTLTHQLVLEGLFGVVKQVTTTKELMTDNVLSDLDIHCIILKYPKEECQIVKDFDYQKELEYLVTNERRNNFIVEMVSALQGNTLVLYQLVEKHGSTLYRMMSDKMPDRTINFIHGGIKANEREKIRNETETGDSNIIVASYGTYSTGVNIRNLHNIVFASPSKSRIRNLQSIGRVLRKSKTKIKANLFDISDKLTYLSHQNYTWKHLLERMKIYQSERFDFTVKYFNL
ncbi:hypothetical protein CL614_07615 [archaeon]|nr:hypothetical protein [archaeon]|tara:strand:- start:10426 stop:11898 length:1473 start_codon:yes stop_codon:yes gene_type:complete